MLSPSFREFQAGRAAWSRDHSQEWKHRSTGLKTASRVPRHRAELLAPLWSPSSSPVSGQELLRLQTPSPTMAKPPRAEDQEEDPTVQELWAGAPDKLLSSPSFPPLGFEKEISEGPLVLMSNHLCGVPNWLPSLGQ